MTRRARRSVAAVACLLPALAAVACTQAPTRAGPTPDPATASSPSPTSTTRAPQPWDLLYLSDSSGWKVAEAYVGLAEKALGVPVRLVDARAPNRMIVDDLRWIREHRAEVAAAEIVVLEGGPVGSGVPDSIAGCVYPLRDPGVVTEKDWRPFGAKVGQAVDAVWAARGNRPTVVRVVDLYVADLGKWSRAGVLAHCTASFEAASAVTRAEAEAHGAVMVSAYDAVNGVNHDRDAVPRGLIGNDGMHLSEAGGDVVARALAATGFEPTRRP